MSMSARSLPLVVILLALAPLGGCDGALEEVDAGAVDGFWPVVRPAPDLVPLPADAMPTVLPAAPRIVAIGDVHGDLLAARAALSAAGVIDDAGRWIGDDTVAVQLGDQLDRGDDERIILDWFEQLRVEAEAAGGGFHPLIGNHEVMNVGGNLNYVTPGGFAAFADIEGAPPPDRPDADPERRGRVVAFAPGGPYARVLSRHNVIMVVGDTVFVHGNLALADVAYGLEAINRETQAWMAGEGPIPPHANDPSGPLWARTYGYSPLEAACDSLQQTLDAIPARRLVVAHTVQGDLGINPACDGRVWRVDVGLAAYYGGPTEALEIVDGEARVLRGP